MHEKGFLLLHVWCLLGFVPLQSCSWKILVGGEGTEANLSSALGFQANFVFAVGGGHGTLG